MSSPADCQAALEFAFWLLGTAIPVVKIDSQPYTKTKVWIVLPEGFTTRLLHYAAREVSLSGS